ncbi:MAG: FtsW/RodA/SpoVE family cell cycle protein [Bacteroidota bacterium]
MKEYLKYLKGDNVIWIISLLMLAFSLVSVYSFVPILVKIEGGTPFKYLSKQIVYVLIAFGAMFWLHKKDSKYISMMAKFAYYLSIAMLLFTFFFAAQVNGAGRWIRIPFVGLTFQSSDFAKLALIVYLARTLVKKKDVLDNWREGFVPLIVPILLTCGLILKDNFSTAALVFAISLVVLFIGRVPIMKILATIGGIVGLFVILVLFQKAVPAVQIFPRLETWENRVFNRYSNEDDIKDNAQAKTAELGIYNGGLFGQGVGDGKVKEYTPEAYADFYYASFVEEFGSISAAILIFLYLILLYRIISIGLRSDKLFETYICLAIGILLLTQASVNMLVCTGVFPVTGQNMPLLAMGGSALIMTCIAIGIVQSIAYRQMKAKESPNEEINA